MGAKKELIGHHISIPLAHSLLLLVDWDEAPLFNSSSLPPFAFFTNCLTPASCHCLYSVSLVLQVCANQQNTPPVPCLFTWPIAFHLFILACEWPSRNCYNILNTLRNTVEPKDSGQVRPLWTLTVTTRRILSAMSLHLTPCQSSSI